MKDLNRVSRNEQKCFFDSFDQVMCDVDGVLWHYPEKIPGADCALKTLKNLNKAIIYVSNKTTRSQDEVYKNLKTAGFELEPNDLIMPELAVSWYLKKINFDKEIFLLGMHSLREHLQKAGFKIAKYKHGIIPESVSNFFDLSTDNDAIGAVISDTDVNTSFLQLQKAAIFLKRPETLFITTNGSKNLYSSPNRKLFGPGYFDILLEDFTGREPLRLAKPSIEYNNFVKEQHQIGNPSRVLFIGDSIEDDMAFACNCGYKKLLVLSGITQKEWLEKWDFPEGYKPDYYVESLTTVRDILLRF